MILSRCPPPFPFSPCPSFPSTGMSRFLSAPRLGIFSSLCIPAGFLIEHARVPRLRSLVIFREGFALTARPVAAPPLRFSIRKYRDAAGLSRRPMTLEASFRNRRVASRDSDLSLLDVHNQSGSVAFPRNARELRKTVTRSRREGKGIQKGFLT